MDKIDLRQLNNDELFAVRKQVVRLKRQGKTGAEIEGIVGIYQTRISQIWQMYLKGGVEGIKPKVSGRKPKGNMLLSPEIQKEIRRTIISKTPNRLKLAGFLWTLAKISKHIWDKYHIKVSTRSLSNYMKRWGLTCQRPTKQSCGQDVLRVKKFKEEEYPAIRARAVKENAQIFWADETGIKNTANFERGFSEKGKPPALPTPNKKERVNMISAIADNGALRFKIYESSMNQQLFIDFLSSMIRENESNYRHNNPEISGFKKTFVIVDNLRVHHGKFVKKWLEKHKEKIELFFMPPYSPELNPTEYLNNALKHNVHTGEPLKTKKHIKSKIQSFMRGLQKNKERVRRFFRHKKIVYCLVQG
jgi:transposase